MFGYLPAPFVFGLLSDSGKGNNLRIAMRVLTCVPIVTAIFLFTVSYNIHLYGFSNKNK
jgi:biotin transporter BioY